jgi:hypothetical protein
MARRITEEWGGSAKSVFQFAVQGQVAKSTQAGISWLQFIREHVRDPVHFWPFDGWEVPAGRSAIVELYPRLRNRSFPHYGRTGDQQDAYSVAATLSRADHDDALCEYLNPS